MLENQTFSARLSEQKQISLPLLIKVKEFYADFHEDVKVVGRFLAVAVKM
jgi:hypothetical protein